MTPEEMIAERDEFLALLREQLEGADAATAAHIWSMIDKALDGRLQLMKLRDAA